VYYIHILTLCIGMCMKYTVCNTSVLHTYIAYTVYYIHILADYILTRDTCVATHFCMPRVVSCHRIRGYIVFECPVLRFAKTSFLILKSSHCNMHCTTLQHALHHTATRTAPHCNTHCTTLQHTRHRVQHRRRRVHLARSMSVTVI